MANEPSRRGAFEYIQLIFQNDDKEYTYDIRAFDFTVDFQQGLTFKEFSEKGIDTGIYTLGGTVINASFRAVLNNKDFGIYKLIDVAIKHFEHREVIQPTNVFKVFSTYYGKLYGCVVESFEITIDEGGPVEISFNIAARYLDYTQRQEEQLSDGYKDMVETRDFMFFDINIITAFDESVYHLPEYNVTNVANSFTLSLVNEIQRNWTLAVNDDIGDEDDGGSSNELLPQSITAAKDISIGSREIKGTMSYIMPHTDLYGFYKVLDNTHEFNFYINDTLADTAPEFVRFVISRPVFRIPSKPITTGVLNQTTEIRGIRRRNAPYDEALQYYYIDEDDIP